MRSRASGMAVLALAGALAVGAPTPAGAGGPNPLDAARQGAGQTSFVGVMQVRWRDGRDVRVERVTVEAHRGSLMFKGGTHLMAVPGSERLVQHGGSWNLLWPAGLGPEPRPDASAKYTIENRPGPLVAGLPTTVYDIFAGGRQRERLHLHSATSLLLSREQFDQRGEVARYVGFDAITLEPSPPVVPPPPADQRSNVPRPVRVSAAPGLTEGFQRLGVYRRSGVTQALYSDGLYDLSVFEQRGRLRRDDVPVGGTRVAVGGAAGWSYAWPGGNLIVWEAGGSVLTAVSDAPLEQLLAAARSVPPPASRGASFWAKLRAACATLVQPLGS